MRQPTKMNHAKPDLLILIRGVNDVGSAVAHRLFTSGYSVVIHETPQPATTRRGMSFTDAVFGGNAALDGVEAQLVKRLSLLRGTLVAHRVIPVVVKDFYELLKILQANILVDARMRKHLQPEVQRGLAELTIGLGPNFIAGETTDLGIETNWGEILGQIIDHGATNLLQGEPREIDGHARDRYVYAPIAGTFRTMLQIGASVAQGQEVGRIDSTPLLAPVTGVLRGLTHNGVPVTQKTKVIEVDPRIHNAQVSGIGERPARIAEGVFSAIQTWEAKHVH
jgi:xanthine dehydrogenase accessory factor